MATGLRNSTKGPAEAVHRLHNDDFHAFVDRSEAPITRARISRWRDPMWRRTEEASGMMPDHAAILCQSCYSRGDVLDRVPSRSA
ncbi:MAG: hypothetical protein QOD29_5268 [Alphaproteobacteria bacterium]|nr:hypothetical protein [Alphaproteobacteria bacterium]